MKIAYVTLHWPRTISSSIGKKIIRQTKEWKSMGHEVHFFSHLHHIEDNSDLVEGNYFFYDKDENIFSREFNRITAVNKMIGAISDYNPDLIYLRWGMYIFSAKNLLNIAPTVVEINTNDKKEHVLLGLGLNIYNRTTRHVFLKQANGMLFTSNELVTDPAFNNYVKTYQVVSNGIDLESMPFYEAPNNQKPHLVFLGTPGMAWHGLDKLLEFGLAYPDIQIDIVGATSKEVSGSLPNNVLFHGYLQGEQFEILLANADAAIGSISLHLKEMEEASPLKIRDCAGRGIPCILPYQDTDLSGLNCKEILQIPNTPTNLVTHGQQVHDFIYNMRGKRLPRLITKNKIDIGPKEKKRIAFFEVVLKRTNH